MNIFIISELFLFALGLAADAFAVSICQGLSAGRVGVKEMAKVGLWFGGFQALMPTAGYFLGSLSRGIIEEFDHWIAFVLLAAIGVNMIRESFSSGGEAKGASFSAAALLPLAVATSIDAFAVGIALAMSGRYRIAPAALMIGCVTFTLCFFGLRIGAVFGEKYRRPATVAGGLILILLGGYILSEHMGLI